MKKQILFLISICILMTGTTLSQTINLTDLEIPCTAPILLTNANDGSGNLYVVERIGNIISVNGSNTSTFLDLTSKVYKDAGEMGLLGLAFHPDYKNNGFIYVNYNTKEGNTLYTNISRFKATNNSVDLSSELTLLKIVQPFENHNGGSLLFGNDGYLYIALGDGGSSGDPLNNAQNLAVLLGKILRIDVDNGSPYAIPNGNPFKGNGNAYKEEIYAYGLRNPWKMTLDKTTGKIWAADVGQNNEEEIDIIESGKNYGWKIMEGSSCYSPSSGCTTTGLTLPVYSYTRTVTGTCSVIGGYVYRGSKYTDLSGLYIYGDFCSGDIWGLSLSPSLKNVTLKNTEGLYISSFGEDEEGELYVLDNVNYKIYKIEGLLSSLSKSTSNNIFSIYPNPVKDQVSISLIEGEKLSSLEIYDAFGSKMNNTEFKIADMGKIIVNTSSLPAGVYTLNVIANNKSMSTKFVVLK